MELIILETELDFLRQQKEVIDHFGPDRADEVLDFKIKMQEFIEELPFFKRRYHTKLYRWFDMNYPT